MNNLKYYEDSLAYDFSLFAPAEKTAPSKKGKVIDIPQTKKAKARKRRAATAKASGKVTAILVTIFIIGMLSGNIILRSQISATEHKIDKLDREIALADSKLASLSFEVDQKISYANLEESAKELGMKKMDKTQIVYVRTNAEDNVVLGDKALSVENN